MQTEFDFVSGFYFDECYTAFAPPIPTITTSATITRFFAPTPRYEYEFRSTHPEHVEYV